MESEDNVDRTRQKGGLKVELLTVSMKKDKYRLTDRRIFCRIWMHSMQF